MMVIMLWLVFLKAYFILNDRQIGILIWAETKKNFQSWLNYVIFKLITET